MSELIVEYSEKFKFNKVHCSEGHYITDFDEVSGDIKTFVAAKVIYCPVSVDVEAYYHCLTEEEYNERMNRKIKTLELEFRKEDIDAFREEHPEAADLSDEEILEIINKEEEGE